MEFRLVIVAGQVQQTDIRFAPPAVIGRSREADITIGHPMVSRRHCRLSQDDDGKLLVEDLGSLNGTFIDELRITEQTSLEPGARLRVGAVTFQVFYGDHDSGVNPSLDMQTSASHPVVEQGTVEDIEPLDPPTQTLEKYSETEERKPDGSSHRFGAGRF